MSKSVVSAQQTFCFEKKKNAGGRRAQEHFCQKRVASEQTTLFFGEQTNAGGRRAQEYRTFVKKVWFLGKQRCFFGEQQKRQRPLCTGAQDFCKKVYLLTPGKA